MERCWHVHRPTLGPPLYRPSLASEPVASRGRLMSIYDEANDAFERGEMEGVKEILAPNASLGDPEAQAALGSFLTLSPDPDRFVEGVGWLRTAADAGDGVAAHNLATILLS